MSVKPQSVYLKRRFFRFILLLGLALFITFSSISSFFLFRSTKIRIQRRYHAVEKGLARYLERRLFETRQILDSLRRQLDKKDLRESALHEEFNPLLKGHPFLCSLASFDPEGALLHFSGKKEAFPPEYFKSLKAFLVKNRVREGFWHKQTPTFSPTCSGPAFFLPTQKSTLAIFLSWDNLWQEVKDMFLEKASDAALLDKDGVILGATFPLDTKNNAQILKMREQLKQGNFHLLPALSWKLVFFHDPGSVYDFMYRDILQFLLLTAVMLMIFLLGTGRFLGRIFTVLKQLVGTTHVVSQGIYDVSIPGKEYGEIYELAVNFENMLRSIQWREKKILSAKERLKATQKLAKLAFFEYYPDAECVVLSEELEDWLACHQEHRFLSLEELIAFISPTFRTLFHEKIRLILQSPDNCVFEVELATPKTEKKTLEVRLEVQGDKTPKILGILQDITEQKKIKQEIILQSAARAEAEAASQAKDALLANVSHELRTPLTNILGMSETILKMQKRNLLDDEKLTDMIKSILSSGQQLSLQVDDILEYSQLETGILSLKLRPLHLNSLLEEMISRNKGVLQEKGLSLLTHIPRDFYVLADEKKLKQILFHLLDNAAKFSRDPHIYLSISESENKVLIDIKDTGVGIAPENQERIFLDLVRLDKSGFLPGAGLGLPLARKLARQMGGDIYLKSVPLAGSVFTLALKNARTQ